MAPAVGVAGLALGRLHACARMGDGSVRCWGSNVSMQLDGTRTPFRERPVAIAGFSDVVALAAGERMTCAVLKTSAVRCTGYNWRLPFDGGRAPIGVKGMLGALDVAVGTEHVCVRMSGGHVRCWGGNDDGQLGDGTRDARTTPLEIPAFTGARAIVAGSRDTCAIAEDGRVRCASGGGGVEDAVAVATSDERGCAVRGDGSVVCWGNGAGALECVRDAVDVRLGDAHACLRTRDGRVLCWGDNAHGELGRGAKAEATRVPRVVWGLDDVVEIAAGAWSTCARTRAGGVYCWGDNRAGQLGDGTTETRARPTPVSF